jgi:hypothetical protein
MKFLLLNYKNEKKKPKIEVLRKCKGFSPTPFAHFSNLSFGV